MSQRKANPTLNLEIGKFKQISWLPTPLDIFIVFQGNTYGQREGLADIISVRTEVRLEGCISLYTRMLS